MFGKCGKIIVATSSKNNLNQQHLLILKAKNNARSSSSNNNRGQLLAQFSQNNKESMSRSKKKRKAGANDDTSVRLVKMQMHLEALPVWFSNTIMTIMRITPFIMTMMMIFAFQFHWSCPTWVVYLAAL